jgi:broad specificity phosphatase PhoE
MNQFYIARHGETLNNRDKRLSGWIDSPLTDNGLKPTQAVITKLQNIVFTALYSSDLGRAFITAYTIARGINFADEILRLADLREVNYGDAANMFSADAYEKYPLLDRDTHFVPLHGESLAQMQTRVLQTIIQLNKQYNDTNILIVAHSGLMAALNANYQGTDFGAHNISEAYAHDYVGQFTVDNTQVTSFNKF